MNYSTSPRIATVASPSVDLSIQDLHDSLREIEKQVWNMSFPKLIDSAGKEPLGGGVLVGITSTLQDVKVAFEARPGPTFVQCNISGGNLVAVDSVGTDIDPVQTTAFTQIVRTSSSSATLQEQEDIQHSAFDGGITIDAGNITGNALAGTAFPAGTSRQPVLSVADAKSIAATRGIDTFFIKGAITFGATDVLDNITIKGDSMITQNVVTMVAGVSTMNSRFLECTVVGTLKGKIDAVGVIFQAIVDMAYDSWLLDCWFEGDVTLTGGGTFININGGVANDPGVTSRPTFDYTNVSTAKSDFLRWSGPIGFRNVTAGNISLNMSSGKVYLEATNTAGAIVITPGEVDIDDQSGAVFSVTRTLRPSTLVTDAVNASSIATDAIGSAELSAAAVTKIVDGMRQKVLTESYAAKGAAPTYEQFQFMLLSLLSEFSIASTTITHKKIDGAATSMTHTTDHPVNPTSRTRTT